MSENFPVMRGDARVARGASSFEVPLFSHVIDNLWQGCSPAEFPDELEGINPFGFEALTWASHNRGKPVKCHWLMQWNDILLMDEPRFDAILNLFQWGEYVLPEGVEQLTVEMYDSLSEVSDQVDELADTVIRWLNSGKRVLVHCQAGLNRSSLVVARILMKKYSMTADEAIKLIRDQRSPTCLCNETFENYLRSLDGKAESASADSGS